jgi:uncharacterized circularly permuted ATP-grasp superfamily protein/uncharacterized alpha-E superfamily protein
MNPSQASVPGQSALFGAARPTNGAFDELNSDSGQSRPHWRTLTESLDRLGPIELAARAENCRRILREHGVSCFVNQDGRNVDQPWRLDLLPLMISADEWRTLESGLIQRARLLNLVLHDLHGTQRLVRDGFIPAPLVYANPGYHRACQAATVPVGGYLHTYAVDLARSPDGRWWVIADRTQAPPGIGFMLENRTVLSRVLPETVEAVRPRSFSESVQVRRDMLRRFASSQRENPTIVLLTPGPRNEAYFEHAYLARLLGFTLVEGEDLTVRDRRVFIKTLDGLREVHVILRRVAGAFCDPLELRGDSLLGVPGLVEATRAGHVTVMNPIGSSLLESPAFLPFLRGLSNHLLGEELQLPSVATWWCGQGRELSYVREHFEKLVLRPAFTFSGRTSKPAEMSTAERTALLDEIISRPHEFVAQEEVQLSHAPVWADDHTQSHPFVMRLFVLFNGENYQVMPGGLAHVLREPKLGSATVPLSGLCKDVWVLPEAGQTDHLSSFIPAIIPALERTASDLPSRTADNFFWLGRYTERLENVVRTARCTVGRLSDDTAAGSVERIQALGQMLVQLDMVELEDESENPREALQEEIFAILYDEDRPFGVGDLLSRIHFSAFSVRYRLSADTWRVLNHLEPEAHPRPVRLPLVFATSMLNTLVMQLAAFNGMEMENMTRSHGWVFLELGRRIERATNLAQLIRAVLVPGMAGRTGCLLEPALEISDSVMTYRRRYFAEANVPGMLELLLLEPMNPRSLSFQLARIEELTRDLPGGAHPDGVAALTRRTGKLAIELQSFEVTGFETISLAESAAFLDRTIFEMSEISELLTQVFFSHVTPQVN